MAKYMSYKVAIKIKCKFKAHCSSIQKIESIKTD